MEKIVKKKKKKRGIKRVHAEEGVDVGKPPPSPAGCRREASRRNSHPKPKPKPKPEPKPVLLQFPLHVIRHRFLRPSIISNQILSFLSLYPFLSPIFFLSILFLPLNPSRFIPMLRSAPGTSNSLPNVPPFFAFLHPPHSLSILFSFLLSLTPHSILSNDSPFFSFTSSSFFSIYTSHLMNHQSNCSCAGLFLINFYTLYL